MKDIIELQIKNLKSYKFYNHKQAMSLNKGDDIAFLRQLIALENHLVDGETKIMDDKLIRNYGVDNSLDDNWQQLTDDMIKDVLMNKCTRCLTAELIEGGII